MKRVWAVLAAVATLAALGAAGGGPAVAANSCDQAPSAADANGKNVALVIHGWNGTAMKDTRDALQQTLGDRWLVSIYDYPELAGQWPDSSSVVTECLRKTIRSAHTATGSPNGNVYIVAHSMGGLLARFALNPAKDPTIGNLIGGVVTLDTPHHGSPLGATAWASIGQLKAGTSGNAGRCLAIHHPGTLPSGCEAPPWLPAGVPLAEIAGDTSITRNFFMFGYYGVNTNSDGAVWVNSQTGYTTSADGTAPTGTVSTATVSCEYKSGAIAAAGAAAGSIFSLFSSNPQEFAAGLPSIADHPSEVGIGLDITNSSPCGHGKMPTNVEAINRVAAALQGMPTRTPQWAITGTGMGPIVLGQTLDQAKKDPSVTVSDMGQPWCGSVQGHGWTIAVSPGQHPSANVGLAVLGFNGPTIPGPVTNPPITALGITLGATEHDLLTKYPDLTAAPQQQDRTRLVDSSTGYRDYATQVDGHPIAFGTYNGVVDSVVIGADYVPFEMCE